MRRDRIAAEEAKIDKRPAVFFMEPERGEDGYPIIKPDPESEYNGSLFGDSYMPPEPETAGGPGADDETGEEGAEEE